MDAQREDGLTAGANLREGNMEVALELWTQRRKLLVGSNGNPHVIEEQYAGCRLAAERAAAMAGTVWLGCSACRYPKPCGAYWMRAEKFSEFRW